MSSSLSAARTALDETHEDGHFRRTDAAWRESNIAPGSRFEPEAGRYHLYVSLACPWAAGALAALHYHGLEDTISVSVVHPTWRRTRPDDPNDTHSGWWFRRTGDPPVANELGNGANACDEALVPDTVSGCKNLREVYELAGDTGGKYSTPLLWCKKHKTIVANESMDILKILDSAFGSFAKTPRPSLFPPEHAAKLEELNGWIYPSINNGVYRCGFAKSQSAYDSVLAELFQAMDKVAAHLDASPGPFLTGDHFTYLDLRLYHTLVRCGT